MSRLAKLQEFLASDPNDSFTHYALGLEYAKEQNFPEAIRTLEVLRARDPNYIPTYYMLAGYYKDTGKHETAAAIYSEGILKARAANDLHAMSELQAALDGLEDELF